MKKILLVLLLTSPLSFLSQNIGINFDNIDDYIVTSFNGIPGGASRSVQVMFYGNTNTAQRFFVDMGETGAGWSGSRFSVKINPTNAYARIEVGGGGFTGTIRINDNTWHQITATYDSSLTTNQYKLYVDGVLDVQGNLSIALNTPATSNYPVTIGARTDSSLATIMDGSLDEVRIWSKALSAAEISANYNKEICGTPSDLVAYYKMNEGVPTGTNTSITSLHNEINPTSVNPLFGFAKTGSTSNYVTSNLASATATTMVHLSTCDSYTWSQTGLTYHSSGTYNDTLSASVACDSVVSLILTIDTVAAGTISLSSTSDSIIVSNDSAKYQWIDCNNGMAITSLNDTNQSFIPSTTGDYACIIYSNFGCSDTTQCFSFTKNTTTIDELTIQDWNIYPNPATNQVNIEVPANINSGYFSIYNSLGKLMKSTKINGSNNTYLVNTSDFANGVYSVVINSKSTSSRKMMIINN